MAITALPAQFNQFVSKGLARTFPSILNQPGTDTAVQAAALSGATELRVDNLKVGLSSGDPLLVNVGDRTIRIYTTGAVTAGQDAGQKYRTIPVSLTEEIPKGASVYFPRNIQNATLDCEIRTGFYDGDETNLISKAIVTIDDVGTPATRGLFTVDIPGTVTDDLTVSLTDYDGLTLNQWLAAELPRITLDSATHPLRWELVEEQSGDRYQIFIGVLVVGNRVAVGGN